MKLHKEIRIAIIIISSGITAMIMSYVPELNPDLFGDWYCNGYFEGLRTDCRFDGHIHNRTWHWGYRHYVWLMMGISLLSIQIYKIVKIVEEK